MDPANLGFPISDLNLLLLALTGGVLSALPGHEETPPTPVVIAALLAHHNALLLCTYPRKSAPAGSVACTVL